MKRESPTIREDRIKAPLRIRGLYLHIPFCLSKCRYCSFFSVGYRSELASLCLEHMLRELENWRDWIKSPFTLYVGGGTPTVLGEKLIWFLERVLEVVASEPVEFTVEANPATYDRDLLLKLRALGVNRLSVGVQSLDDGVLAFLGRVHTADDALRALDIACGVFENVNADIIFAVPGQGFGSLEDTLERLLKFPLKHVSAYGLSFEEGTRLFELLKRGEVQPVGDEVWESMYYLVEDALKGAGFVHYEVSNYAVFGFGCLHNMVYWCRREYIGVGPSACGFVAGIRYRNPEDIGKYVKFVRGEIEVDSDRVSREDAYVEKIMLYLRTSGGIPLKKLSRKERGRLLSRAEPLIDGGLLRVEGGRLTAYPRGFPVLNSVLAFLI